jgi:hypothetical protein
MSEVIVDTLKHSGNSSTANLTLASSGAVTTADDLTVGDNLIATKQNGCQRIILEQFFHICDGSTIATSAGNITLQNVTAAQNGTTSWVDLTGSVIAYEPPSGTTMVIYEFSFMDCWVDVYGIDCFTFYIDSDEVTNQRFVLGGSEQIHQMCNYKIGIPIGGSASTTTGRQASWSSAKTLKLQYQEHGSGNEGAVHMSSSWISNGNDDNFRQPSIGITAIG